MFKDLAAPARRAALRRRPLAVRNRLAPHLVAVAVALALLALATLPPEVSRAFLSNSR